MTGKAGTAVSVKKWGSILRVLTYHMSGLQSKLHCDTHALWLETDPDRSPIEHNMDLLQSSKFKFQDTTAFGTCKLGLSDMVLMSIRLTIIPLIGI